ncbi:MAG: cellulase family glycosylhydrolase [Bacteroidales bacterium]|nr:cellulase family glycosylhydrolase [Bacteroidales bacterium]
MSAAFAGLAACPSLGFDLIKNETSNSMPRYKGFNLLDFFSPFENPNQKGNITTEEDLKWLAGWGFDFVRIPMAYPRYLNADFSRNITPDDVYKLDERKLEQVDNLVYMAHKHGLHVSLNLHRAPGYCINAGFHEPYNLWKDAEAQEAFYFHWGMWAKRYKDISSRLISFDLLNEPTMREDMNDQYSKHTPVPGGLYREIARKVAEAIRSANPGHFIIADGNNVGNDIIPEIEDLNIAQSCRGYFPHYVSHYKAPWVFKDPSQAPEPVWPGTINNQQFGREQLEAYYKPWIELSKRGVGVHCGECGCWNKTPHAVFLAWFEDVLDILTQNKIGYALWNFRGDFGILDSGRNDVEYEDWHGHKLDGKLLGLLKKY